MNEQRRAHYLEAMGLDTYVPRWRLPNACSPVACELAFEEPVPQTADSDKSLRAVTETGVASDVLSTDQARSPGSSLSSPLSNSLSRSLSKDLSNVLADLSGSKTTRSSVLGDDANSADSVTQNASESASESGLGHEHAEAKFHLGLWYTDTGLQVLDSREEGDALPIEVFLSNVLVGNGLIHSALPPMETQNWPFPGALEKERTWKAACIMLSDFFQARFQHSPARAILAFGEDAAKSILGEDLDFAERRFSSCVSENYNLPVYILPALREFLYEPDLKRALWEAFSPLRSEKLESR